MNPKLDSVFNLLFSGISKSNLVVAMILFLIFLYLVFVLSRKNFRILSTIHKKIIKKNHAHIKKIEASSLAKDLFLANISHEIRTPLGAILGFVELALEDKNLSSETRNHLSFVNRNSHHLLNLVEDLFDLSKANNNKLDINSEKTDLLQLLCDVYDVFFIRTETDKIVLQFKVEDKMFRYIKTDSMRLKQILINLVGNAIKFSKPGDIVKLNLYSKNKKFIFDVKDQGVGIPEDKKDVIFNSFEQVESNYSRQYEGAGLGLSICKSLTHLMAGQLELIRSQEKEGSHFRVSFPLNVIGSTVFAQNDFDGTNPSISDGVPNYEKNWKSLNGKKILLAEDSIENQILFRIYLEAAGMHVEVVDTGTLAVKHAMIKTYDLVIMDIQMPELDGYQAIKILKESKYDKKVLALTAHATSGEKEKCFAFGFDGYLSKPVSKKMLLTTIMNLID